MADVSRTPPGSPAYPGLVIVVAGLVAQLTVFKYPAVQLVWDCPNVKVEGPDPA